MPEKKIKGGKVIFFGSEEDKPCGLQIVGSGDLGNPIFFEAEVFSCDDIGLKMFSTTHIPETMANLDSKELVSTLIEGIERCGCKIDKEKLVPSLEKGKIL
jgi:hypothetical protein